MKNEIQMKNWRSLMAEKLGISDAAVAMRLSRGKLKPKIRRVNARLIYVQIETNGN